MDRFKLLRWLVIGSSVLYGAWFLLPLAQPPFLSHEEIDLLKWNCAYAVIPIPVTALLLIELAYLPIVLALLCLKSWSRWLFTGYMILNSVFLLSSGMRVDTPLSSLLGSLFTLANGAILVLLYLEPAKARPG